MKKLNLFVALLTFILTFCCYSEQKSDFIVMIKSGEVSYRKANDKDWQKIIVGQQISMNIKIKIENGYLALLHKSGKTIEFKTNGIFELKSILKIFQIAKSDLKKQIAEYIYNKLSIKQSNVQSNDIVGGIERGIFETKSPNEISCYYPQNTKIIDKYISFCWSSVQPGALYKIILTDKLGKQLFEKKTADTTLEIEIESLNPEKGSCIYWQVTSSNFASKQYCLLSIYEKEIDSIKNGAKEISSKSDMKTASDNIIMALYYEEKKIMYKAVEYYKKAVALAPNVPEFKEMLNKYLNQPLAN